MTTPPKIHVAAVDAAAAAVFKRHDERGDPHLDEMGHKPADVLAYLRRRYPDFAQGLRVDDLDEVAVLLLGKWWDDQRETMFWLDQVVKLKASRKDFAAVFGIGAQGFKDWLDRLHALLDEAGPGRPDEQAMRADRAAVRSAARPGTSEQVWVEQHRQEYAEVARELVELYMLVDEDSAASIAEVRRDLNEGAYEEGDPLIMLGMAMEALADAEVVLPQRRLEDGQRRTHQEISEAAQRRREVQQWIEQLLGRWTRLQQLRQQAAQT